MPFTLQEFVSKWKDSILPLFSNGLCEAEKKRPTLTNLYNARSTWLDLAHKWLDEAVFAAYGWNSDLSDEGILERVKTNH